MGPQIFSLTPPTLRYLQFKIKMVSRGKRAVPHTAATGRKLVISDDTSPKHHSKTRRGFLGKLAAPVRGERLRTEPLACNSANRPVDVVASEASDVCAQAVPDQVDVLKLEERILLRRKKK